MLQVQEQCSTGDSSRNFSYGSGPVFPLRKEKIRIFFGPKKKFAGPHDPVICKKSGTAGKITSEPKKMS